MSSITLTHELELACAKAKEAASLVMQIRSQPHEVRFKQGDKTNPVTDADEEASKLLVAGFRRAYPNDAILSEELSTTHDPCTRQGNARLWCIDPIDGTSNFVAGGEEFAVMVGLAIGGQAALGVVLAPATDTLWAGIAPPFGGACAFMEKGGQRTALRVSAEGSAQKARLMMSSSRPSRLILDTAKRVGLGGEIKRMASVGLKSACIAQGLVEVYISPSKKTHEWDACGPEAIVRGAGGMFTDLRGERMQYNKQTTQTPYGLMASHGPLHNQLVAALALARVQHA